MVTVTPAESKALNRLKKNARRYGITQDQIAAAAGVTRPLVVNVFALRRKSANVVAAANRLVSEARARALEEAVA